MARFNVPILTSHTILEARGKERVRQAIIARVDESFQPVPGTEKELTCDCILIAVGLDPVDEFIQKAQEVGLPVFSAGDAEEIAEASSAMFSGKITGLEIAQHLGIDIPPVPESMARIRNDPQISPGEVLPIDHSSLHGQVFPVMHCRQEIPVIPVQVFALMD